MDHLNLAQIKSLFVGLAVVFSVALKAGIVIGSTGSALEALGLFLQRFSNSKVRAIGSFFVTFGKQLEAVGTDIPKIVSNARVWYAQVAKLLGLALVFFLVMSTLDACSKPLVPCSPNDTVMAAHAAECRARVEAECVGVPDSECPVIADCDAWGEARCGVNVGGSGGQDAGKAGAK